MRKRVTLLRRRTDVTRDTFATHWRGPHAELIKRLPGVKYYVQDVTQHVSRGDAPDGLAQVWFDELAIPSSGPYSEDQLVDERRFLSGLTTITMAPTEHVASPASVWLIGKGDLTNQAKLARSAADAVESNPEFQMRDHAFDAVSRRDLTAEHVVPDFFIRLPVADVHSAVGAADTLATSMPTIITIFVTRGYVIPLH